MNLEKNNTTRNNHYMTSLKFYGLLHFLYICRPISGFHQPDLLATLFWLHVYVKGVDNLE